MSAKYRKSSLISRLMAWNLGNGVVIQQHYKQRKARRKLGGQMTHAGLDLPELTVLWDVR